MKIKKSLILTVIMLFFTGPFFSYQNTDKEIPLSIKYYIENDCSKDVSELDENRFMAAENPMDSGFFEGVMWLEVNVPEIHNKKYHYIFTFGDEYIDFAEVFIKENGKYKSIGRTGHRTPVKEMKLPDRIISVPYFYEPDTQDENQLFRIKIINTNGSRINIRLISEIEFIKMQRNHLKNLYISGGICLCIFFIIFICGITLKDKMYIFLSFSALFFILFQLQMKGTGPVFLWNHINSFEFSGRLVYFFENFMLLFLILSALELSKERGKVSLFIKIVPLIIQLIVISFLILIIVQSNVSMIKIYTVLLSLTRLVFILFIFISLKSMNHRIIFISWTVQNLIALFAQTSRLLRTEQEFPLFAFMNRHEFFFSLTAFFLLTLPALCSMAQRTRIKIIGINREIKNLCDRNTELEETNRLSSRILKDISYTAGKNLGTADILSQQLYIQKNVDYIEIIKQNSAKINDTVAALRILENRKELNEQQIMLYDFFKSCIQVIKAMNSAKKKLISYSISADPSTVICADTRILELVFLSFINSVIEVSEQDSKISILLEDSASKFILTISNKMHFDQTKNAEQFIASKSENHNFDFIILISKIYGGVFSVNKIDDVFMVSLKLNFKRIKKTENKNILVTKTAFSQPKSSKKTGKDVIRRTPDESEENEKPKPDDTAVSGTAARTVYSDKLSARENQIAELITKGKTDKEIAEELFISPGTVSAHNKKIFKKLDVHSRVELINKLR